MCIVFIFSRSDFIDEREYYHDWNMRVEDIHILMQNTHINCQQKCIVLVFSEKTNTIHMC